MESACASVPEVVRALRSCGLFFHRGDILAWLAAASGEHQLAALVLGAVDEFHVRVEDSRDRFAARARDEALRLMNGAFPATEQELWMSHGRRIEEAQLVSVLEATLAAPRGAGSC